MKATMVYLHLQISLRVVKIPNNGVVELIGNVLQQGVGVLLLLFSRPLRYFPGFVLGIGM